MSKADANEFPKMLYKKGSEMHHEGHDLDTLIVEDADGEAAARKDGFKDLAEAKKAAAKD